MPETRVVLIGCGYVVACYVRIDFSKVSLGRFSEADTAQLLLPVNDFLSNRGYMCV